MAIREAVGIDGTSLVYSVTGAPDARPLVLLHGWAQSSKCWGAAVLDEFASRYRVIAVDLRGHGYSGAPDTGYDDSTVWAGDVDAVLEAEGVTSGAVLLGWSYGGLVICDYLEAHGTGAVDAVVFVSAITSKGRGEKGEQIGSTMRAAIPDVMSDDPRAAIRALGDFGTSLTGPPEGKGSQLQALLGASLSTPPRVRAALFRRTASHDDLLRSLDIPAFVVHGTKDSVVDVATGIHAADLIPNAQVSFWDGCEHGPFVEDPERFVKEVGQFVDDLE
ncbi:alpha/beta hydrolase [Rhodococcus sp. WMMA185]|uniref:alpha/beta fold hydrolase n=1 Tax=Rhodococcus sp. WMMA185 TaxID=679318 RepID=UPI000877EFE3|nr:alpha/beta hydrolase [Rhodococcus sp. WMMA185]AOW93219.1 alpha/beta hydrolase [Rhodococcus sp. WMMA185]